MKLSRKFYDTFGDEIANELVEWFNQVDLTYRTELRELNEINFARFDAKLEQRIAEVKAELRQEIAELRTEMRAGFAELRSGTQVSLAALRSEMIKWMFIFWAGSTATMVGLALTVARFLKP